MKHKVLLGSLIGLLFIGTVLVVAGIMLRGQTSFVMTKNGISFISQQETDPTTVTITQEITDIQLDLDYADLSIMTGEQFSVTYDKANTTITTDNGKLCLTQTNSHGIVTFGSFDPPEQEVIITIPPDVLLSQCDISLSVGGLKLEQLNIDTLVLNIDLGDTACNQVNTNRIVAQIDVGALSMQNCTVQMSGDFAVNLGDLNLDLLGDVNDYNLTTHMDLGDFHLNGVTMPLTYHHDGENRSMEITVDVGDCDLHFNN